MAPFPSVHVPRLSILLTAMSGISLEDAADEAIRLASTFGVFVNLRYDATDVIVRPLDSVESVRTWWQAIRKGQEDAK